MFRRRGRQREDRLAVQLEDFELVAGPREQFEQRLGDLDKLGVAVEDVDVRLRLDGGQPPRELRLPPRDVAGPNVGRQVPAHHVRELEALLLPLRQHLLDRHRLHVDVQLHRVHQRPVGALGVAEHLEPRQRRQQDLVLARVLREPAEEGAAVHHPHLHLQHQARLAPVLALAVPLGHAPVQRRRHEGVAAAPVTSKQTQRAPLG